jgi:hypothetical protein
MQGVAIGQGDPVAIAKATMLATIHDGLGAVIRLAEGNAHSHMDTIARSMQESLGDLYHLSADPNFLKSLQFVSAKKVKAAADDHILLREGESDAAHIVEIAKARKLGRSKSSRDLARQKACMSPSRTG